MNRISQPAVLVLADGTVFQGKSCGFVGVTTGEIAFNTAMTGYQEVFTDPSYFGQVLVMATAHIGNYGVHSEEIESETCKVAGVIIKSSPMWRVALGLSGLCKIISCVME